MSFSAHVFFDDAFLGEKSGTTGSFEINEYVKTLKKCVKKIAR